MLEELLQYAAPLTFAALGALLTELSGSLCIACEGFMTCGAFFSYVFALKLGSVFWGSLCAALLAIPAGWTLCHFITRTGANPFVGALSLNIASAALCASCQSAWFATKGVLREASLAVPAPVLLPLADLLPLLGPILSPHSAFVYLSLLAVPLAAFVLRRTSAGLRLRACGLSDEAALAHGVVPARYRRWSWAACAFLSALAGAALTWRIGAYVPGAAAGRPWIALAAVYLGFRNAWGAAAASLLFAGAELFTNHLQAPLGPSPLPATAFLGLPSLLALLLYAAGRRKPASPAK